MAWSEPKMKLHWHIFYILFVYLPNIFQFYELQDIKYRVYSLRHVASIDSLSKITGEIRNKVWCVVCPMKWNNKDVMFSHKIVTAYFYRKCPDKFNDCLQINKNESIDKIKCISTYRSSFMYSNLFKIASSMLSYVWIISWWLEQK